MFALVFELLCVFATVACFFQIAAFVWNCCVVVDFLRVFLDCCVFFRIVVLFELFRFLLDLLRFFL